MSEEMEAAFIKFLQCGAMPQGDTTTEQIFNGGWQAALSQQLARSLASDKYYGFGKRHGDPKPVVGSRWMTRGFGPCTIFQSIKTCHYSPDSTPYYMFELSIDKFPSQVGMMVGQNGFAGTGKRPEDIAGFINDGVKTAIKLEPNLQQLTKENIDNYARTEVLQFLTDAVTSAGMLYHGKTDKAIARRVSDGACKLRGDIFNVQAQQQAQPTVKEYLTAQSQPSCEPVAIVDRRVMHGNTCVFIERTPRDRDIPDKTLLYASNPDYEELRKENEWLKEDIASIGAKINSKIVRAGDFTLDTFGNYQHIADGFNDNKDVIQLYELKKKPDVIFSAPADVCDNEFEKKLKTVTFNPRTHKVVPLYATEEMIDHVYECEDELNFDDLDPYYFNIAWDRMASAAPECPADSGWISVDERLPVVKHGDEEEFNVHVRIKSNGRIIVRSAHFLNEMEMDNIEEDEKRFFSGWHSRAHSDEFEGYYEPLDELEVISWMPLPTPPNNEI
jgi:hypothetical protein